MLQENRTLSLFCLIVFLGGVMFLLPESSKSQQLSFEAEGGGLWFSRNDVRIPNDGGTDFDMLDLIGQDVIPYARLRLNTVFGERHTVRILFAPIRKVGTGVLAEDTFFEETEFAREVPTEGIYRFNTYRLTYRYTFLDSENWTLGAGAAALIRDAKVELVQTDRSDSNTDLGFVPLIHLYAAFHATGRTSFVLDAETLASTQGRATDVTLMLNYRFNENWEAFGGYRLLEGGADVDEVFNFAWINFAALGLGLHF